MIKRISVAGILLVFSFFATGDVEKGSLALNEDNSHFFGARTADDMTRDGLLAFVDQYAGTKITHLFLCPNSMKTSYRSTVWDAIWELGKQDVPKDPVSRAWVANAKLLHERQLDPYAIWIARCREKHIAPWLSMRMNDVHNVDDTANFIHSAFWVQHPDYWRVPGSTGSWVDRAFDYGIPEVREHHMALVKELLERYDVDGLELDWMRFGYHFKPGEEAKGAELLTDFMRQTRTLANQWSEKRQHSIKIGVRVPTLPDSAKGLGMDAVQWAKEGLIDHLVVTPFWATTDFDIPIETWRKALGDAADGITLSAGAEIQSRAYPVAKAVLNDLETVRGFAASQLFRGADEIYLFNYMDKAPMQGGAEAYRALLEQGLDLVTVTHASRRHPVTYRDTVAPGMSNEAQLPEEGFKGGAFRIHIGPAPKSGTIHIVAALAKRDDVQKAIFTAQLNGAACEPSSDFTPLDKFPDAARAIQFTGPLDAAHDGYNEIHLIQLPGAAEQGITWVELRIEP